MTREEIVVEQLKLFLDFHNKIEEAQSNTFMPFLDSGNIKGYASLQDAGYLQNGVKEPKRKDLIVNKPKEHTYKEFLQSNPRKEFITPIIIASVLLFVGLNFLIVSLSFFTTKNTVGGFVFLAFFLGVLITGLVLLLKGLSKKKQYSQKVLDNRANAEKLANEANKKDIEEWETLNQSANKRFEEKYEKYLKDKELYEDLLHKYDIFIEEEKKRADKLRKELSNFIKKAKSEIPEKDKVPFTYLIFESKENAQLCLKFLKTKNLEESIQCLREHLAKEERRKLYQERIEEEEWEQRQEEKRMRQMVEYQEELRRKAEKEWRYEQEKRERSQREQDKREREEEERERMASLRREAANMCNRCANVVGCRRKASLSTPSCGGFRPSR